MHLADVKWKADVFVIMGQNFRGLIAANEIVKVILSIKFCTARVDVRLG